MGKGVAPPEFLIVGRILAPWGIKGEVKVEVITDFPERFAPHNFVYLNASPFEIESCRPHKQFLLLKLATIDSIEAAEKLRGCELTIPRSELPELPEGQYYTFQLIGLDVVTTKGQRLGQVTDIMATASNDVYIVEGKRGDILIPAIDDVVKSIDLKKGTIIIEAIEGLLD
ncbi:MAG TPA: ribosome maturation factor RimM [Dehalococcoidia bacterium]|nr:ribosome maturation factor RimM [Dehalococcoidia bacterium]